VLKLGGVESHGFRGTLKSHFAMDLDVGDKYGKQNGGAEPNTGRRMNIEAGLSPGTRFERKNGDKHGERQSEEQAVVGATQGLDDEEGARDEEISAFERLEIAMKEEQAERHPSVKQQLEMSEVGEIIREKSEHEPG